MTPTVLAIITAAVSAISAFVGAWLAARLALDRFRHEKIWERRAATYTVLFEMLYDVQTKIEREGGRPSIKLWKG